MPDIDPSFLALPAREARRRRPGPGCRARRRARRLPARTHPGRRAAACATAQLDSSADTEDVGLCVRVVHEGTWGFASGIARTADAAAALAEQAVATAQGQPGPELATPVVLAAEPVYADVTWVSPTRSTRSTSPRPSGSAGWPSCPSGCWPPTASTTSTPRCMQVLENKFYADTAGTTTTQQRVRVAAGVHRRAVDRGAGAFSSMRTLAPPAGRGWEYLTGTGWDFDAEIAELPELLREHVKAPSVEAGRTTW